jgi:hypothetical protein
MSNGLRMKTIGEKAIVHMPFFQPADTMANVGLSIARMLNTRLTIYYFPARTI